MTLRAYSVHNREAGPGEGALLVFANTAGQAKKLGFGTVNDWFDSEWHEVAAHWLRQSEEYLAEQEGVDLEGEPRLIESPKGCQRCELWGEPLDSEQVCESCRDNEDE